MAGRFLARALVRSAIASVLSSGAVFAARASSLTVLHDFSGPDGSAPFGTIVTDPLGALYGVTTLGGANSTGVVYKLADTGGVWTETVLFSFPAQDHPVGGISIDQNGVLYGVLIAPGQRTIVYSVTPHPQDGHWSFSRIYEFPERYEFGPISSFVTIGPDGALYGGTELCSCVENDGEIYRLSHAGGVWSRQDLYVAQPMDPLAGPASFYGPLAFDASGNLFGTSLYGPSGSTVWRMAPPVQGQTQWTMSILASSFFDGGVALDSHGNIYSQFTGDPVKEWIAEVSPPAGGGTAWTTTVLQVLNGRNGTELVGPLTVDETRDGYVTLLGVAGASKPHGDGPGLLFRLVPTGLPGAWSDFITHEFKPFGGGGTYPRSPLLKVPGRHVHGYYGTALEGGAGGDGQVFLLQ